jgi:SAM-dependent methyltransferase
MFRFRKDFVIKLKSIDYLNQYAIYECGQELLESGNYKIANYDPLFQFFLQSKRKEAELDKDISENATVNAKTWELITNYHEHREHKLQDSEAHQVSKMICEKIKLHSLDPKRILELGCGSGRNLDYLGNLFPDAEIIGVDINLGALEVVQLSSRIKKINKDVLKLNWDELGSFDVIMTSGFLMHINHHDIEKLFSEIALHTELQIHFELHGPRHDWDFHRYPRDYAELGRNIGLSPKSYELFSGHPTFSFDLSPTFSHSLFIRF